MILGGDFSEDLLTALSDHFRFSGTVAEAPHHDDFS